MANKPKAPAELIEKWRVPLAEASTRVVSVRGEAERAEEDRDDKICDAFDEGLTAEQIKELILHPISIGRLYQIKRGVR